MRIYRKPAAAAAIAVVALVLLSSIGIAGTTWGGRSYTPVGSTFPGASGTFVLSAPAPSIGTTSAKTLSVSGGTAPVFSRSAANKVILCADPCLGPGLGVNGSVSGLGNSGDSVNMTVQTAVIVTCTNNGGNASPGRNLVVVLSDTDAVGTAGIDSSGRFFFTSSDLQVQGSSSGYAIGQVLPNASQHGCSNDNWTATVANFQFLCSKLTAIVGGAPSSSVLDKFSAQCTLTL